MLYKSQMSQTGLAYDSWLACWAEEVPEKTLQCQVKMTPLQTPGCSNRAVVHLNVWLKVNYQNHLCMWLGSFFFHSDLSVFHLILKD